MKIPLFSRIVSTKKHTAKAKFINSLGQIEFKDLIFVNTNKLLANPCYKGVKTGSTQYSGGKSINYLGCLITLYE
jgi:D-alanyl-D-alanine carboxypeptidase